MVFASIPYFVNLENKKALITRKPQNELTTTKLSFVEKRKVTKNYRLVFS